MKTAWERNEFCRGEILERCYEFMFLCVQNKVCIVFTVSMVSFCVWKLHVLIDLTRMSLSLRLSSLSGDILLNRNYCHKNAHAFVCPRF